MASIINQDSEMSTARWNDNEQGKKDLAEVDLRGVSPSEHHVATETLARKLSARQVQMIAIGGECNTLYLLASHSLQTLILIQAPSVRVCSWAPERVLPLAVLHPCSSPTLSSEPSSSSPCCLWVRWLLLFLSLARSVPLLGKCVCSTDPWSR